MEIPHELLLKQLEIGPMQNFQYFIGDKSKKEVAVVDPAWDVEFLCQTAEEMDLKIVAAFLTHTHPDHCNGLNDLLARYELPIYISKEELEFCGFESSCFHPLEHDETIQIGDLEIQTIFTPGHTIGGVCYKYKDVLITGDTLFIGGCGHCKLPGANPKQLYNTLYNVISKLPDSTILFTGHNYGHVPFDTLGEQKKVNPYLTCQSEDEFLSHRMGLS